MPKHLLRVLWEQESKAQLISEQGFLVLLRRQSSCSALSQLLPPIHSCVTRETQSMVTSLKLPTFVVGITLMKVL